jgi:outer membrane protein
MNKSIGTALVAWNVVLTALCGWALLRTPSPSTTVNAVAEADSSAAVSPVVVRDTAALKEARIAYFNMDSLQEKYDLVKEREASFTAQGRQLESALMDKMQKAQARYNELMSKDHTYSTKAELEADEAELKKRADEIQEMRATSQERLDRMQMQMLQEITDEIMGYLKEYNAAAGFDYIFSIQDGGQIWVGNEGLNITRDVLEGLNARHRARKEAPKK